LSSLQLTLCKALGGEAASHAAGGGSTGRGGGGTRSTGDHLDGDAATEGAGVAGVDELDEAGVGLAGDVARAGGASGHVDLEGVVLVDVGGALHDADCLQGAGPGALVGLLDLALVAGDLGLDLHLRPALAGAVGVEHGLVGASAVGGDNVQSTGDGATGSHLGQGVARESHGGLGAGLDVVVSLLWEVSVYAASLFVYVGMRLGGTLTPLVRPQASACLPLKTVVSGSVTLFLPAPGITPPWIPRAVEFPPASPVATAILPWAATRGEAARAKRKILENILAVLWG
jgi:hypothetical protein